MASGTTYIAMWFGLVLVAFMMFPVEYEESMNNIYSLSQDPTYTFIAILESTYNSMSSSGLLKILAAVVVVTSIYSGISFGQGNAGLSVLFIIPTLMIYALFNFFLLPTTHIITAEGLPIIIKYVFVSFLGLMTLATGWAYSSGRP